MLPLIFERDLPLLGPLEVPSYFLMLTIAFLVGTSLGVREARREGIKPIDVLDFSLVILAAALIGARLAHVFLEAPWIELPVLKQSNAGWGHFFCRMAGENHDITRKWNLGRYYLLHPQMTFALWNGGVVFYGGLILGIPSGIVFCRRRSVPIWRMADLAGPILAVGLVFGRIGCLLAGCCHGTPIHGAFEPVGIVISSSGFGDSPLWPTQPMEGIFCGALALGLYRMRRIKLFEGQVFVAMVMAYSIWRPINEVFRGDDQRGLHAGLTTSQWISIGLFFAAGAVGVHLWRTRPKPGGSFPAGRATVAAASGA